ncbi:GUN4 domain-containing protein [Dendronalium sp. ChiSLP03b]|uniref:GUN4 domain-containing protein n=1 Tax=Dendronalium sp. ChiSLP03b TaxID=3075381 RepID=UPI002AD3575E|nr:GUN4 domain-containing protein [Dendronalium sp. ChiSLP03b]MDZ8206201.1 GUN4 domain-containing protein [Dendronalium sp. ChiSLP03b]
MIVCLTLTRTPIFHGITEIYGYNFGFSVQKLIWKIIVGNTDIDLLTFSKFGDIVGCRVKDNWKVYLKLTFETTDRSSKIAGKIGKTESRNNDKFRG